MELVLIIITLISAGGSLAVFVWSVFPSLKKQTVNPKKDERPVLDYLDEETQLVLGISTYYKTISKIKKLQSF